MTEAFLAYSQSRGNGLVMPVPGYGVPGPGAAGDGVAPPVVLDATHARALQQVSLADPPYHVPRSPDSPVRVYRTS